MISIIGAGRIGSACALSILHMRLTDLTLIDVQKGLAEGEALDMRQASPSLGFDGKITGSSDFADVANSELVIVTAGYPRKPEMSRRDLAQSNANIVSSVVEEIVRYAPDCKIMLVTNPVDAMTYLAYKKSGFARNRVFGMSGMLDASRYRSYLALQLNVSRQDVQGLVIGEHGDLMIPLVDYTTISGIPIRKLLGAESIKRLLETTRSCAMDVIRLKGATVHAPASVVAVMADAVLNGRNRVTSACVIPNGEYGLKNLAIGLPVILGKNGVERIIELDLNAEEKSLLVEAASSIQSMISQSTDVID